MRQRRRRRQRQRQQRRRQRRKRRSGIWVGMMMVRMMMRMMRWRGRETQRPGSCIPGMCLSWPLPLTTTAFVSSSYRGPSRDRLSLRLLRAFDSSTRLSLVANRQCRRSWINFYMIAGQLRPAMTPPSVSQMAPVTQEDLEESRRTSTTEPMSPGRPTRPMGWKASNPDVTVDSMSSSGMNEL